MNKFGKILIIAPHPDDEVLGCGGIMSKYGNSVSVFYVTSHHPAVSGEVYMKEKYAVLKKAGIYSEITSPYFTLTNKLDTIPMSSIISEIESVIEKLKPDTIFTCFPSYNQDHRVVYEATVTATRPHDKNHFVKNVLVYEQPETLHSNRTEAGIFVPNVFVPIDISSKLELYSVYNSQVRGHRSPETIKGLAALRGSYINKPYAEAFSVLRMTHE